MFGSCCMPFDVTDLEEPEFEVQDKTMKQTTFERLQEPQEIVPNNNGMLPRANLEWCRTGVPELQTRRRCAATVATEKGVYVIGGYDGDTPIKSVEYSGHDSREEWNRLADIKIPTSGGAVVIRKEKYFYAMGGYRGSQSQALAFEYDIGADEWQELPKLTQKRGGCAAAVLKEEVHVIGGHDGYIHLSTIEAFRDGQWSVLDVRMKERRSNCAAAVLGDAIYAVGGENERGVLATIERFQDGQWEQLPAMKIPRTGCGIAAVQNFIVVVGGSDGSSCLDSCEMFDTVSQEWHTLPAMSTARGQCCAASTMKGVSVFGGFDRNECLSSIETLDIFHILPKPPFVPKEPTMLHGSAPEHAKVTWITQAHVAVDTYDVSVKAVTKQVHQDYEYKQRKILMQIEVLRKELNQAATDRDGFLCDLSAQTDPWFSSQ